MRPHMVAHYETTRAHSPPAGERQAVEAALRDLDTGCEGKISRQEFTQIAFRLG